MPVFIHDQDGHADDHVATLLLACHPAVDLRAVIVNSGDSLPEVSARVLAELLDQLGHGRVPVAWQHHAVPHPFPLAWQRESLNYERDFPGAQGRVCPADGTDLLIRALLESTEPATLLVTGPLSNLDAALRRAPQIAKRLARVVLMAGGLEAGGNGAGEPGHDGSGEWNLYCDPKAAARCLKLPLPFEVLTLDVTNFVPLTGAFLARLGDSPGRAARMARTLLGGVEQQDYYCWDTFAALLACEPDFLPSQTLPLRVRTDPPVEGRLEVHPAGTPAQVWHPVEVERLTARVQERFLTLLGGR